MNKHADQTQENKSQSVANAIAQKSNDSTFLSQFEDIRPEAVAQRNLIKAANNSPQSIQMKAFQELANNSPQTQKAAQWKALASNHAVQNTQHIQQKTSPEPSRKENNTGLPDHLKSGIENLSGYTMNDVKVHYNSDKPAQLQARAYAQGSDIHIAPGQERLLPHEAWHVVQQKQGRVKATVQMKNGVNVNNDANLEQEADSYGHKALQFKSDQAHSGVKPTHYYNSSVYQLIGADQQSVQDDGNKMPTPYQVPVGDINSIKGHIATWGSTIPTLNQFETATSKFLAFRSSDAVLTQIDGLLTKFNQLGNSDIDKAHKKELAQEMVLACEFWLKKVNKVFTGKQPVAAGGVATNIGGNSLKLAGAEERRSGISSLSTVCSYWLESNQHGDSLNQIVNDRKLENQGMTDHHGNKDVVTWDQRAAQSRIFPETGHRAGWNNSRAMDDQDYVVLQNDDQRRTAKLVFRGGVAYRWQNILNPNSTFNRYTSPKAEHFAMDKYGHIYNGTLGVLFFHSSLLGFGDALSAGMMRIANGNVVYISNDSGHYKPNVEAMVRVLRQLQRYGVNVNNIQVERLNVPGLTNHVFTGAQILASEYSKWPDQ
jgi:Domain of unknown function (DUF4157)